MTAHMTDSTENDLMTVRQTASIAQMRHVSPSQS
jgi:hypothetical protein